MQTLNFLAYDVADSEQQLLQVHFNFHEIPVDMSYFHVCCTFHSFDKVRKVDCIWYISVFTFNSKESSMTFIWTVKN